MVTASRLRRPAMGMLPRLMTILFAIIGICTVWIASGLQGVVTVFLSIVIAEDTHFRKASLF